MQETCSAYLSPQCLNISYDSQIFDGTLFKEDIMAMDINYEFKSGQKY